MKPLDHDFLEGMRQRIDVAKTIDKLQAHIEDPKESPLSGTQLKAAEILLRKVIPDLKSIEHSGEVKRPESRDALIERLTAIHAGTAPKPAAGTAAGNSRTDSANTLPI